MDEITELLFMYAALSWGYVYSFHVLCEYEDLSKTDILGYPQMLETDFSNNGNYQLKVMPLQHLKITKVEF